MCPPKAVLSRRMNIIFAIRVCVMIAMMRSPPEWTFLMRKAAKQS